MSDEYIPIEIWREAKEFIQDISDDVEIFNKFKTFDDIKIKEEALKFAAWWDFKRYQDYPHSLFLMYENLGNITRELGSYDVLGGFDLLQMKFILFYRLLHDRGIIDE